MDAEDRRLATEARKAQIENAVHDFFDRVSGEVSGAIVAVEIPLEGDPADAIYFHDGIGGSAARVGLARLAERFFGEEIRPDHRGEDHEDAD